MISERYSWIVTLITPVLLLVSTITAILLVSWQWGEPAHLIKQHWFSIGDQSISANLQISNQSVTMMMVVSIISFLVHFYSVGYMAGDPDSKRYFAMLGFFTFSMQGIVLADNLLLLFVFWELVGFSSYMLIGHYMQKQEAAAAAKKAFIMNRVGDALFMVGLMIVWSHAGSFNITDILPTGASFSWQTTASLCIFCGVMGKSAQFPLFTWLPDAMQGPTPVSALIHAATMVAAGVYLLARIFPLFTSISLTVVSGVGAITAIIGALAALSQYDIKKILAYSTISQLGLMIMAIGMEIVNAALLHLFTHAFFKACLFLGAGAVIHSIHQGQQRSHHHFDPQDIRCMGGLRKKLPVTFIAFLISGASLAGIPFFSGFLSKEAILASVWTYNNILSWVIIVTIVGVSFITVMYTFRLIWFVFMGSERDVKAIEIDEPPFVMRSPIILLAVSSLWFIVSWNPFDFTGWMLPVTSHSSSMGITIFSAIWVLVAFILSWLIFKSDRFASNRVLRNGFYIDDAYEKIFPAALPVMASITLKIDRKWIDGFIHFSAYAQITVAHIIAWVDRTVVDGFVTCITKIASWVGALARSFQGGKIQLYIFWSIFAIIIFLIWKLN